MTSSYTDNIGIEKPETGDQVGTWGITDNLNYDIVDQAISGYVSVTLASAGTSGSPNNFAITDGALSNGRNPFISFTDGGDLGGDVFVRLTSNAHKKMGWIENNLSGSRDLYVFQGNYNASNDYVIPAGQRALLRFDGGGTGAVVTNVLTDARIENAVFAGNLTVGGTLGVTGLTTLSGAVNVTGDVTISSGDAVVASGQGIDFSDNTGTAATGATTTSELLDWYEEGAWTPSLWDSSSSDGESQTYSARSGLFVRIGREVFFHANLNTSSLGSLSGTLFIGNLPYTASSSGPYFGVSVNSMLGVTIASGEAFAGRIESGEARIRVQRWNTAGFGSPFVVSDVSGNLFLSVSGHYTV